MLFAGELKGLRKVLIFFFPDIGTARFAQIKDTLYFASGLGTGEITRNNAAYVFGE